MDVIRGGNKLSITENQLQIGDEMEIPLRFESDCPINITEIHRASCSGLTKDSALFIFNDPVGRYPMNVSGSNIGGYWQSDLSWWIETDFAEALPDWLREHIYNLGIPSVGEIFGGNIPNGYEPDCDDKAILSQKFFKGISGDFWLRNAFLYGGNARNFAECYYSTGGLYSHLTCDWADNVNNVVPEFWYQFEKRRKRCSK